MINPQSPNFDNVGNNFQQQLLHSLVKLGKLDVMEQRILDLSESMKELRTDVKFITSDMFTRTEYEKKGNTGKFSAIRKDIDAFRYEVRERIDEKIKQALDERDEDNKEKLQINYTRLSIVAGAIVSVVTTILSFILYHFFGH